jgi:hypothetical protein
MPVVTGSYQIHRNRTVNNQLTAVGRMFQGWKKPGFKKKQPVFFLGFFFFFWFFKIYLPRRESF